MDKRKQLKLKIFKEKNQNLKLKHNLKYALKYINTFFNLNKTFIPKYFYLIKYCKEDKIYYNIDYINLYSFYYWIKSLLKK